MDSETRLLHEEGCAPKPQLQSNQIKKEDERGGEIVQGIRLPMRLPIGKVELKNEKEKSVNTNNSS